MVSHIVMNICVCTFKTDPEFAWRLSNECRTQNLINPTILGVHQNQQFTAELTQAFINTLKLA